MASERVEIDIDEMPELRALVEEAAVSGKPVVLKCASKEVAVLRPTPKKPRKKWGQPLREDDPIFKLIGIGSGPRDLSERKHEYLAEGYLEHHHNT
jgi:hypothetical protein